MSSGNGTSSPKNTDGGSSTGNTGILTFVGVALFIALGIFLVFYYVIKIIIEKLQEPHPSPLDSPDMTPDAGNTDDQLQNLGLDLEHISLLPTFPYQPAKWRCRNKEHDHKYKVSAVDCAVCLGELEEGEMVRVLPTCKHYFHVKCIDMWLSTRSSCPMCRANLEPEEVRSGLVAISPPWHQLIRSSSSERKFNLGSCLGSPFVKTPRKSPSSIGASPFHTSWQGSPSIRSATPQRDLREIQAVLRSASTVARTPGL